MCLPRHPTIASDIYVFGVAAVMWGCVIGGGWFSAMAISGGLQGIRWLGPALIIIGFGSFVFLAIEINGPPCR